MSGNPFTPTFGVAPPVLAGRQSMLAAFRDGLEGGVGSPERATLYVGARGSGKTVMLTEIEDLAVQHGWVVVNETATPGFIDRLTQARLPSLRDYLTEFTGPERRRLNGVTLPARLGGFTLEPSSPRPPQDLRGQITEILKILSSNGTGLLITVDEISAHSLSEFRDLSVVVQHAFREGLELAFAGASLRSSIDAILNEPSSTFIRRAERQSLEQVPIELVIPALVGPLEAEGHALSSSIALQAAEATEGYAFMIQLLGFHLWRAAQGETQITSAHVVAATAAARRRLGSLVIEPTLNDLSDVDRTVLLAMARDDGDSLVSDLQQRLDVESGYISMYRDRLIKAGVIEAAGRGRVRFSTPGLREYLREHPANIG